MSLIYFYKWDWTVLKICITKYKMTLHIYFGKEEKQLSPSCPIAIEAVKRILICKFPRL
jgi:hypothetical protein